MGGPSHKPCDHLVSNEHRLNTKPVQTGFVLIFQCINYKNIRLHYTFAILRSSSPVVVRNPPEKVRFYGYIFVNFFLQFLQPTWAKQRHHPTPSEESLHAWQANPNHLQWSPRKKLLRGHPSKRRPSQQKTEARLRSQRLKPQKPNE